jgi:formamidopyrimidine-DNA glycosylase
MPELPEVETIACGVHERLRGDRITEVWFGSHAQLFKTPPALQAKGLEGRAILAVHRTGKHLVCELGTVEVQQVSDKFHSVKGTGFSPYIKATIPKRALAPEGITPVSVHGPFVPTAQWIVHLGMTGRLLVTTPDAPLAPHTHARLTLASGRELRFVDPRRFGRLDFLDLTREPVFTAAGADPLTITAAEFAQLFHARRLPIKAALLNQTLLSGVGNIYADESLFRSGIRPRRRCARLTGAELERLRLALCEVLEHAIRLGGSSVSDYVDADGVRGFFQLEHCVYLRTGLPCRRCNQPIRRIVLAGRGTHYCPKCQR